MFRAVGGEDTPTPTLLFDEIDAIFGKKARDREDLRGMLNAGYRRGAYVLRMGGAKMTELQNFPVFCAKAFAGIGNPLPDTIVDRSIPIRLQRRTRDETVERFRRRDVAPQALDISKRIVSSFAARLDKLHGLRPELPDDLDDRAQDVWEPLLAIADTAGSDWPKRARTAALELSAGESREDDSLTAKLIVDICKVFTETEEKRLRTADLIEHLSRIEESPWGDWYGKPISPQKLSQLLRVYRIRTMSVWVDGAKRQGYKLEQFVDAFTRVGSRGSRGSRPSSSIEAAPTPPTPPTPLLREKGQNGRPPIGDPWYQVMLANAVDGGHLTETEGDQQFALHEVVAASRRDTLDDLLEEEAE